jgi:hypothetical protein
MTRRLAIAAVVLLCAAHSARAGQVAIGSMPIPVSVPELAAAAGVHRVDASTLPLDIVRSAFASPDGASTAETAARAAIGRALNRDGGRVASLPLPLGPKLWGERVLRADISDGRLASAIFTARPAALLYHGLMGVDPATLAWIEANPALLDVLYKHPGVSAVYARSIRIRDGRVVTPGDAADDVWEALVGADPGQPVAFVAKLFVHRSGRLAGLYDAVAHLDSPHQAFAIGRAADSGRIARARRLFDAVTRQESRWRLEEHPFMRPDVDAALFLRVVRVNAAGEAAPPALLEVWSRLFGGADERGPIDAAWLAERVFEGGDSASRERLDTFLFGQRALGPAEPASQAAVIEAIDGFRRYPALMLTLESHGLDASAFAAAARAAAALERDDDAIAVFQAGLAIVDRARRSRTLDAEPARSAIAALLSAAASRAGRERLIAWVRADLLDAFRRAIPGGESFDADALVLAAMAGLPARSGPVIVWEEQQFRADLSTPELHRLTTIRKDQNEQPLDAALGAATARGLTGLARSMAAIVYADALGEPDGRPAAAGPVWRRHRFDGHLPGQKDHPIAWRIAGEVFAPGGWHLAGSLLRLDAALASLALRRLDSTLMPLPSVLSTTERRTLALSVALSDPRSLTDQDRDAVAAALARGRARAAGLSNDLSAFEAAADAAGLSEWRRNAARWTLASGARVVESFTLVELLRLGGGEPPAMWGAVTGPVDGCLCLRFPATAAWEEFAGRASTGQMATQLADVMLRTAEALSARRLPALLARDIAAFAMQDVLDQARPVYFDDWLPVAYAARDLREDQFDDYVAALTVAGPLVPVRKGEQ